MTDERPNSLAAQAASWVPPWERAQRPPDPAYAAAHRGDDDTRQPEPDAADDTPQPDPGAADDTPQAGPGAPDDEAGLETPAEPLEAGSLSSAVVASAAEEGGQGEDAGPGMPPELPPVPGEGDGTVTVDAPQELPGDEELDPTDVGVGPEVAVPGAIEEAAERETEASPLVDAPLPEDGDDAGDVFDHAADDDATDDAEVDLPIAEEVPGPEADDEAPDPAGAGQGVDPPAAAGAAPGSGIPAQGRRSRGGGASGASSARTEEEVELAPLDEGELRAALEAILLVVDEPVAEMQLAQIVEQPTERVAAALDDISARYTAAGHGFDLRRAAGGGGSTRGRNTRRTSSGSFSTGSPCG
ncbi:hypothetical protein Asp14428_73360 [Actinoplanes sp. NBRC 14428]|nr:hypothetical protein Asp14428_73360 [Actinoplanes sp. NBRC 14428]